MIRLVTLWGLALLCLVPAHVHALKCYVCGYSGPAEGTDPCKDGTGGETKECSASMMYESPFSHTPKNDYHCYKIDVQKTKNGKEMKGVIKGCTYAVTDIKAECKVYNDAAAAVAKLEGTTVSLNGCDSCSTDLCNSATRIIINNLMLVPILVQIYSFFCCSS